MLHLQNFPQQTSGPDDGHCGINTYGQQEDAESQTRIARDLLRPLADRNAPIDQKQPDAVCQMPYRRSYPNYIHDEDRDVPEFARNRGKSLVWVMSDRDRVESGNQTKAEIQHVKRNKEKQDDARQSLNGIEPIS